MANVLITCPITVGTNNPFPAVHALADEVRASGKKPLAPILAIECANGSLTTEAVLQIREAEIELIKCHGADEVRFVDPSAPGLQPLVDVAVQFCIWDRDKNSPRLQKKWS